MNTIIDILLFNVLPIIIEDSVNEKIDFIITQTRNGCAANSNYLRIHCAFVIKNENLRLVDCAVVLKERITTKIAVSDT